MPDENEVAAPAAEVQNIGADDVGSVESVLDAPAKETVFPDGNIPTLQPPADEPNRDVDPQDPLVVAEDEEALRQQIEQQRAEALADDRRQEPQPTKGEEETKATDTQTNDVSNDQAAATAAAVGAGIVANDDPPPPPALDEVYIEVGNRVWLRAPGEQHGSTVAIVTKVLEDGEVNVTAFFDGETPRPLASVPHVSRLKADVYGWYAR